MTNLLVGDHQVVVVDVDEGVLEGSDMSGTHLNGLFVCLIFIDMRKVIYIHNINQKIGYT